MSKKSAILKSTRAEFGEFIWLEFSVGGKPVAFTISRTCSDGIRRGAKILHVQPSVCDRELYAWMLSEMDIQLAEYGPTGSTRASPVRQWWKRPNRSIS